MSTGPAAPSTPPPVDPAAPRPWQWLLAVASLALIIVILHGQSLTYGLFMDDYAHFTQLKAADWSLRGLVDACRLELSGGIIDYWWMPEVTLRFFRPVSFGVMKLVYALSDWNPTVQHGFSLAWHLLTCVLLMVLLRRLGASLKGAWVIAGLFAIHPGHVATVQWIACQTELMVTSALLGAMLCYLNYRGYSPDAADTKLEQKPGHLGWAIGTLVLFGLALGCRENAVMFPLVLLCVEPYFQRRGQIGRAVTLFVLMFALVGGYVALRSAMLGGVSLPPRPYVVPPTAPDFVRYCFDKACYYLLGEFLLVPCVPIGGLPYFRGRPLVFYGLTLLAVVLLIAAFVRYRRRLPALLGPAWLFGFVGPLLPVFEAPHHLYLPGVGWAMVAGLLMTRMGSPRAQRPPRVPRDWADHARAFFCVAAAALFSVSTYFFTLALDTGQRAEDRVIDEMVDSPIAIENGDTVYFVNLPLIAHYVQLALQERTGHPNIRVHALTWSPRLLGLVNAPVRSELTRIDDRTIEIHLAGDAWFSGPLGLLTRESRGGKEPLVDGPERGEGFSVSALERADGGLTGLRITFNEPLNRPHVHLFYGSRVRWAAQLNAFWSQP